MSPKGHMLLRVSKTQGTRLRVQSHGAHVGPGLSGVVWGGGGLRVGLGPPLPSCVCPDYPAGSGFAPLSPNWARFWVACQLKAGGGSPETYQDLPLHAE